MDSTVTKPGGAAEPAAATGLTEIQWNIVIDAPVDQVWSYLRHFGNLADWISTIETCEIENGLDDTAPGAVRVIRHGRSGSRERLLGNDDLRRLQTYELLEGTWPVRDYRGSIQLLQISDTDQTLVHRSCTYRPEAQVEDPEALYRLIRTHVFAPTMEALRKKLSRAAAAN